MISTKLKKNASTNSLLIEFSDRQPAQTLEKFYFNCKEEGVLTKKECLRANEINFYHIEQEEAVEMGNIKLKNTPSKLNFVISVLYVSNQQEESVISKLQPIKRTLILREGLQTKFYHDYEFENTQSEQESLIYLCQLSSSILNSRLQRNRGYYDQKAEEIKVYKNQDSLRQKLWRNVFFQIPGLGKEKCIAITSKYNTYESLLRDYEGSRELKNVLVSRGTKQMKLGVTLANRVFKCLFSLVGEQGIFQQ